jgi:malonyl CoA-acyl carrier protein transacylase
MRDDPLKGFDLLDSMGAIQEVPRFDRPDLVVEAVKGKRDALVVTGTHEEIDRINSAVQRAGESEGQRESRTFTRMVSLNWTEVEKREIKNFEPGMFLIFHRATKEGKVGQAYEVVATWRSGRDRIP